MNGFLLLSNVPPDIKRYIMEIIVQDCSILLCQVLMNFSKFLSLKDSRNELQQCYYNTTHACISSLVSIHEYTNGINVKFSSRSVYMIYRITDYVYQNFEQYHSNKDCYYYLSNDFQSLSQKLHSENKSSSKVDENESISFSDDMSLSCELSNIKI